MKTQQDNSKVDGRGGGRVTPLGEARQHYWLALQMSQTVGLDLQTDLEAGRITQEDWAGAVARCRGCDWSDNCPAWMASQRLEGLVPEETPSECANARQFNALLADALAREGEGG